MGGGTIGACSARVLCERLRDYPPAATASQLALLFARNAHRANISEARATLLAHVVHPAVARDVTECEAAVCARLPFVEHACAV